METIKRLMKATDTSPKRTAARIALTLGMILLWVEVAQYVLGVGISPIIVGVVFGYGLTDHIIAAAAR